MTLVILAIDALDNLQIDEFESDELKLNTNGEMETFSYQNEVPYTGEVWPTVATGKHPREHGVTEGGQTEWDNILVDKASSIFASYLSMEQRSKFGDIVSSITSSDWSFETVDDNHIFEGDGRYCHNWPCVINPDEIKEIWNTFESDKDSIDTEFDKKTCARAASKFGWVREMLEHDAALIASHVHLLDRAGHTYAQNKDQMRFYYEKVDKYVSEIKDNMDASDEMLILSDHGINVEWLPNDYEIGHHSWRAYSATTLDTRPESVFDVRDWVEDHVEDFEVTGKEVDMPEEQLKDLGYI
jgi:hypothetical protein